MHPVYNIITAKNILKIGVGIKGQIARLLRYFNLAFGFNQKVELNLFSLESELFTCKQKNYTLNFHSQRYYGRIFPSSSLSTDPGLLSVLFPLALLHRYPWSTKTRVANTPVLSQGMLAQGTVHVLIDTACVNGLGAMVKEIPGCTGIEIDRECSLERILTEYMSVPASVLVTADKLLLANPMIKDKIPYFSDDQTLDHIQWIIDAGQRTKQLPAIKADKYDRLDLDTEDQDGPSEEFMAGIEHFRNRAIDPITSQAYFLDEGYDEGY